jgi:hypothetical protein
MFFLFGLPIIAFAISMFYAGKNGFNLIFPIFIWLITILLVQGHSVIPDILSGNTNVLFQPIFRDGCLLLGISAAISLLGMAIGRTAYPDGLFPNGLLQRKKDTLKECPPYFLPVTFPSKPDSVYPPS